MSENSTSPTTESGSINIVQDVEKSNNPEENNEDQNKNIQVVPSSPYDINSIKTRLMNINNTQIPILLANVKTLINKIKNTQGESNNSTLQYQKKLQDLINDLNNSKKTLAISNEETETLKSRLLELQTIQQDNTNNANNDNKIISGLVKDVEQNLKNVINTTNEEETREQEEQTREQEEQTREPEEETREQEEQTREPEETPFSGTNPMKDNRTEPQQKQVTQEERERFNKMLNNNNNNTVKRIFARSQIGNKNALSNRGGKKKKITKTTKLKKTSKKRTKKTMSKKNKITRKRCN